MHANMLTLNGKKMAKSTGNNILPEELFSGKNENLSKGYHPSVVRFFMLQANYRSILDFSDTALKAAEKGFDRLMQALETLDSLNISENSDIDISVWKQSCYDAMNDDFNSPILIAELFEAVKHINACQHGKLALNNKDIQILKETLNAMCFEVLGLEKIEKHDTKNSQQDELIDLLIDMRNEARAQKDFEQSDKIRDRLSTMNIQLKDTAEGTVYEIIS